MKVAAATIAQEPGSDVPSTDVHDAAGPAPGLDTSRAANSTSGSTDQGSESDKSMEVVEAEAFADPASGLDTSVEMVTGGGEDRSDDHQRDSDSDSDDFIPVIRRPIVQVEQWAERESDEDDIEAPRVWSTGHSAGATRIRGRGFLLPRPVRLSTGIQANPPEACPFQIFLGTPAPVTINDSRTFWLHIARRLFHDAPAQAEEIPTDSVESYEVMRRLDYDIGIPADEFMHLFAACQDCGHVMSRYWAEDHPSVCPGNPSS